MRTTLTKEVLFNVIPAVTVTLILLFGAFLYSTQSRMEQGLKQNLEELNAAQESAFADALWKYDRDQLERLMSSLNSIDFIAGADILDQDGSVIFRVGEQSTNPELVSTRGLRYSNGEDEESVIGELKLYADNGLLQKRLADDALLGLLVLLITIVTLVTTVSLIIRRLVTNPLDSFVEAAQEIALADFSSSRHKHVELPVNNMDEFGELARAFETMDDKLTALYRALESRIEERTTELKTALDAAETATKAKADFLASMSHEIRTPMNGVIAMVDLIRQTELDEEQREMLKAVQESGNSLLTIINDILDFSKIEAGRLQIESIEMDLGDVIEGAVQILLPIARQKGVRICSVVDPAIPPNLLGDPTRIRQILFNLGGNAVKFSGKTNDVLIRADLLSNTNGDQVAVKISVIDHGIGITEEAVEKLFLPFSQAESSTTRRFGGTGLGLAICRNLIEMMNGKIGADSQLGQGSTFWCELEFGVSDQTQDISQELNGLEVALMITHPATAEACSGYLTAAGATLVSAESIPAASSAILVIEADQLDRHELDRAETAYVALMESTDSTLPDTVPQVELPVRRDAIVRSVAAAAGRVSPEIIYTIDYELVSHSDIPTHDEALAEGQLVLVAEDNAMNQMVIEKQLHALGYQCDIVENGDLAFEQWKQNDYGIVLTDCHMPVCDGFDLTGLIRTAERENTSSRGRTPIVAVTAAALDGEAARCLTAGMDDVMNKPVDMKILKSQLRKWIGPPAHSQSRQAAGATDAQLSPETSPYDLQRLEALLGDRDSALEVLESYLTSTDEIIAELDDIIAAESTERLVQVAHKLKSSSKTIGADELAEVCENLERDGKSGSWSQVAAQCDQLPQLYITLRKSIADDLKLSRGDDDSDA